ncbi:unnamed protein product [Diamesa serratosioi]
MASKNDLNVSNNELDEELELANEESTLPYEDPDLPIEESSSPNGYYASTNGECILTNGEFASAILAMTYGESSMSNGHSATTNGVQSLTNGTSVLSNEHADIPNGVLTLENGESVESNGHSSIANGEPSTSNGHSSIANGEPSTSNGEDFITRQEHVHDRAVQVLLQNWPVSEKVKQRFEEEKIDYRQLASLNEEDLQMLGIEDEDMQREMVVVFSQLANQNDKKYKAENLLLERQNYSLALIDGMLVHLRDMNDVLAATTIQMELCPPDDLIIEKKYHASEVVLKIIAKMIVTTKKFSHTVRDVEVPEPAFIEIIEPEEPVKEPEVIEPEVSEPAIIEPKETINKEKRVRKVEPIRRHMEQRSVIGPLFKSLALSISLYFLLKRVLRGKL